MKKTPKPHQVEACEFAIKNDGRFLLGDVVGMGKTLSVIMYLEHHNKWPALVVCPSSVKSGWAKEFEEFTGRKAVIVQGERPYEGTVDEELVIVNYDVLAAQMPWLTEQNFEVLIADECHLVANRDNQWTKAFISLSKRCPRVIGMSATPISNHVAEYFTILHAVRPDLFPNFSEYAWKYCEPKYEASFGKWTYKGAKNLDDLHSKVKPFMLRRGNECLNLPPQTKRIEFVDMENVELYNALHKEYVSAARSGYNKGHKLKGADKLTLLSNLLMLVARCKAKGVVRWVRDFLTQRPDEKLLVFCTHTGMLDVIARRGVDDPDEVIVINGSTPAKKRPRLIEEFQTNTKKRLAVLNIKAASAGITLTAATTSVVAQLPWTARDVVQLFGRNHRIGQEKPTEGVFLLTKDTIEEKLAKVIQQKQLIHSQAIEGHSVNELPIHRLLEEEMKK